MLPLVILQALSNEPQHLNSPISTATAVALIGMVGMLITAAIFGDAATRDDRSRQHSSERSSNIPRAGS